MFQYSFRSLWPALQESEVILPLGAYKAPKNGKMRPKLATLAILGALDTL